MNEKTISHTKSIIGTIVASAIMLTLGGCQSVGTTEYNSRLSGAYKNSASGVVLVGAPLSAGTSATAEDICANYPNDERCKNVDRYRGESLWIGTTFSLSGPVLVQTLVPKDVEYPVIRWNDRRKGALLKIRIKGDAPAYFEGIVMGKGCELEGVYNAGIACPDSSRANLKGLDF